MIVLLLMACGERAIGDPPEPRGDLALDGDTYPLWADGVLLSGADCESSFEFYVGRRVPEEGGVSVKMVTHVAGIEVPSPVQLGFLGAIDSELEWLWGRVSADYWTDEDLPGMRFTDIAVCQEQLSECEWWEHDTLEVTLFDVNPMPSSEGNVPHPTVRASSTGRALCWDGIVSDGVPSIYDEAR